MKSIKLVAAHIFALLFTGILFFSCSKKKFDDSLPQLTLQSAVMSGLDHVVLTAKINSKGASDIEYIGFAYSTKPSFSILENQVLFQKSDNSFTATVHAFHDSTY